MFLKILKIYKQWKSKKELDKIIEKMAENIAKERDNKFISDFRSKFIK